MLSAEVATIESPETLSAMFFLVAVEMTLFMAEEVMTPFMAVTEMMCSKVIWVLT